MNIEQQGRRYFWPVLFISAFALGALLWSFWMYQVVVKTRRQQPDAFFTPQTNPPPTGRQFTTNAPPAMPATTNGATGM